MRDQFFPQMLYMYTVLLNQVFYATKRLTTNICTKPAFFSYRNITISEPVSQ